MKETIKHYYNLDVDIISNNDNCYLLLCNDIYYYFIENKRTKEELKIILNTIQELINKNIMVNKIVLNNKGELISNNFILIELIGIIDDRVSIDEMLTYSNKLIVNKKSINWIELWKNKIDYLEYQLGQLGIKKKII